MQRSQAMQFLICNCKYAHSTGYTVYTHYIPSISVHTPPLSVPPCANSIVADSSRWLSVAKGALVVVGPQRLAVAEAKLEALIVIANCDISLGGRGKGVQLIRQASNALNCCLYSFRIDSILHFSKQGHSISE